MEQPSDDLILIHQTEYLRKLEILPKSASFNQFRTMRHRLAWAANTRMDVIAAVNLLSQVTATTFKPRHVERINKVIGHIQKTIDVIPRFVKLQEDTLKITIFSDGSFASNEDLSSQVGYLVVIQDATGRVNVVHYSSTKTKRIVRSVLGAETIALSNAADFGICLATELENMLGYRPPLHLLTDSETLFNVLIKSTMTSELRLMIDIVASKESFDRHEITTISWICRHRNLADAMTKFYPMPALLKFMRTNVLNYDIDQSVKRAPITKHSDKQAPFAYIPDHEAMTEYAVKCNNYETMRSTQTSCENSAPPFSKGS